MPYFSHDDIAQTGTAPGNAAIGAVRISGENAFSLVRPLTRGLDMPSGGPVPRGVYDGEFMVALQPMGRSAGGKRDTIRKIPLSCPARFFFMPAPASYTRENVVEMHLPGAGVLLRAVLDTLVQAGARLAAPGEFTFRAFRNGRLNLRQSEAVEELIRAGDDRERRRALARLGDHAMARIRSWRNELLDIAASLEAALDFAGEELQEDAVAGLTDMLDRLSRQGLPLAEHAGGAENALPHVALVGLANAGKSSLFNALLDEDAVLVSPEASTTRDCLRREVSWAGSSLTLSDNPGYDALTGGGGGQAAREALQRLGGEDLACWVLDASRPLGKEDGDFAARLSGPVILALNKSDLPRATTARQAQAFAESHGVPALAVVETSAAAREGMAALRAAITGSVSSLRIPDRWNRREAMELRAALDCCRAAAREIAGAGRLELAAEDLRRGVTAFSRALGEGYAEETLGRIFSRFCIGK